MVDAECRGREGKVLQCLAHLKPAAGDRGKDGCTSPPLVLEARENTSSSKQPQADELLWAAVLCEGIHS